MNEKMYSFYQFTALKKKIQVEDLLHFSTGGETGHNVDKNFTSNLMNLVMQFRKVCIFILFIEIYFFLNLISLYDFRFVTTLSCLKDEM